MDAIKTLELEVHLIPRIAAKVAKETTDGSGFFKVRAELHESGCFDYGNKTATALFFENYEPPYETRLVYDTRYVDVSDFGGLVRGILSDRYGENLEYIVTKEVVSFQ